MASNDLVAGDAPENTDEDKFFIDSGPKAGVKYPLKVIYCGGMCLCMYVCTRYVIFIFIKLVVFELNKIFYMLFIYN